MAVAAFQNGDRLIDSREVLSILVRAGVLPQADGEAALRIWAKSKEHPLNLAVTLNCTDKNGKKLTQDEILATLSAAWKINYQRVDLLKVSLETVGNIIPHPYADRLGIVPIELTAEKVVFMTSEPFATSWIDDVKNQVKRPIEIRLNTPKQIKHLLNEIFVVQKAFKGLAQEQGARGSDKLKLLRQGKIEELDSLIERTKGKDKKDQEGYVAKIVDWLLNFALMERASDIHLEPKKGLGIIRFRVDGDLRTVYRLDHEALLMVISRFKILGEMKLDEKRKPQDGGIKHEFRSGKQVEMRLSTLPCAFGEKLVVRIFDKSVAGKDLDFIGFSPEDQKLWMDLITQPQGLVLVTGPTGSGKTTTLYTTLNKIATPDVNICTAEDPIEMEVDTFNQVQVNMQINLGFADCIRAFLRQDPDIIMVGEIRDHETGEMAIQSSLTGHLVFSTLHTNGALATIQRLIDLGLPTFLLNSSLSGILAQRLVKKLCPHCKVLAPVDVNMWNAMLDGEEYPMPEQVYSAVGCEECKNSGYIGRLCVYELVKIDDKIKKHIHKNVEITELRERTRGLYVSIRVNGARKVISGDTTIDEILKIAY